MRLTCIFLEVQIHLCWILVWKEVLSFIYSEHPVGLQPGVAAALPVCGGLPLPVPRDPGGPGQPGVEPQPPALYRLLPGPDSTEGNQWQWGSVRCLFYFL